MHCSLRSELQFEIVTRADHNICIYDFVKLNILYELKDLLISVIFFCRILVGSCLLSVGVFFGIL
jgi:hypothetical protein